MIWVVLVVIVTLLTYVVASAGKPIYYRRKRIAELGEFAHAFTIQQGEGSVLVVGDAERPALIEIVKGPDTGDMTQEVTFRLPEGQWSERAWAAAGSAMAEVASGIAAAQLGHKSGVPGLELQIRGAPSEIGLEAQRLAEAALTALGLSEQHRFAFHMDGQADMRIWRRFNRGALEKLSRGSPLGRWFGRRQLEALDQESNEPDEPSN